MKSRGNQFSCPLKQYELGAWEADLAVLQNRVDLVQTLEYEIRKAVLGQCKGLSSCSAVCLQWWPQAGAYRKADM